MAVVLAPLAGAGTTVTMASSGRDARQRP